MWSLVLAKVDPFVVKWPDKWTRDPQIEPVIRYLNRFLHDLWQRTGGGDDSISSIENGELYDPGIQTFDHEEFERDQIIPELERVEVLEPIEVVTTSVDLTTTGSQVVICTNTSAITITLNANPDDGEQLHIKRQNTGSINVSGAIDGDTLKSIAKRYDSPHLIFTIDAGEWSIV